MNNDESMSELQARLTLENKRGAPFTDSEWNEVRTSPALLASLLNVTPPLPTPLQVARQRLEITTHAEFLDRLEAEGIIEKLRALGFWLEDGDPGTRGISFGDLWGFYNDLGRSALDNRLTEQARDHRRFSSAAKLLRKAARELRWALKAAVPMNIGPIVFATTPLGPTDMKDLAHAADLIDMPCDLRDELRAYAIRSGRDPECVKDFAEILEGIGQWLHPNRRGPYPDRVAERFYGAWEQFALRSTGSPLNDVGTLMLKIVLGRPAAAEAIETRSLARQRRRAASRRSVKRVVSETDDRSTEP